MDIEAIIHEFKNSKISINRGATLRDIEEVEKYIDYKFPDTFIKFYTEINGFKDNEWNENMFSVFSLSRIKEEFGISKEEKFIPFCDYLINSHQIGFFKETEGVFIDYKVFLKDMNDKVADTFEQCLVEILNNSEKIY